MAAEKRKVALALSGVTKAEFELLFAEMLELPSVDLSLHVRLPRLFSPELDRLGAAIDDDDRDAFDAALPAALAQSDTPLARAQLARAVLSLRDGGRVRPEVAAVAVIDLSMTRSSLLESALAEAVAVSMGAARTPSGLVLASR